MKTIQNEKRSVEVIKLKVPSFVQTPGSTRFLINTLIPCVWQVIWLQPFSDSWNQSATIYREHFSLTFLVICMFLDQHQSLFERGSSKLLRGLDTRSILVLIISSSLTMASEIHHPSTLHFLQFAIIWCVKLPKVVKQPILRELVSRNTLMGIRCSCEFNEWFAGNRIK